MTVNSQPTPVMHPAELININDTPADVACNSPFAAAGPTVDVPKFTSSELKQLRKNIKRLQTLDIHAKLKQTTHFDITQLFSLKQTRHK